MVLSMDNKTGMGRRKGRVKCSFQTLISPFSIHAINKPSNRTVKGSDPLQHDVLTR